MTPLLASALILGLVTGVAGRLKGSSFLVWMLAGTLLPGIALAAVLLMDSKKDDPRRECPNCRAVQPITAQVCMRCGEDLDYPDQIMGAQP